MTEDTLDEYVENHKDLKRAMEAGDVLAAIVDLHKTTTLIANSLLRDASDIHNIRKSSNEMNLKLNGLYMRVDRLEQAKKDSPLKDAEVQFQIQAITKTLRDAKDFSDALNKKVAEASDALAKANATVKRSDSLLALRTMLLFIVAIVAVVWQLTGGMK